MLSLIPCPSQAKKGAWMRACVDVCVCACMRLCVRVFGGGGVTKWDGGSSQVASVPVGQSTTVTIYISKEDRHETTF